MPLQDIDLPTWDDAVTSVSGDGVFLLGMKINMRIKAGVGATADQPRPCRLVWGWHNLAATDTADPVHLQQQDMPHMTAMYTATDGPNGTSFVNQCIFPWKPNHLDHNVNQMKHYRKVGDKLYTVCKSGSNLQNVREVYLSWYWKWNKPVTWQEGRYIGYRNTNDADFIPTTSFSNPFIAAFTDADEVTNDAMVNIEFEYRVYWKKLD